MNGTRKSPAPPSPVGRKPYVSPRLVSYGHVKDIVQGATGSMADGTTTRATCWIAEALYGIDHPRTLTLRWWMTRIYAMKQRGWIFVAIYRAIGERVAASIHAGFVPRMMLLPLFDVLADKAFDASARMVSDARPGRPL
jgi:hypothetical protein